MPERQGREEPQGGEAPVNGTDSSLHDENLDDDVWGEDEPPPETVPLQRAHHTAGYRDGIAESKDDAIQQGFDDGYPSGAELGIQVGKILGLLQGLGKPDLERAAYNELSLETLFNSQYWDAEARQKWSGVHPLIASWQQRVDELIKR